MMYALESDDKGQRIGDLKTLNSNVQELAVSIVHEYLLNKGLGVLSKSEIFGSQSSLNTTTLLLVKKLDIETLWKINKNSLLPLKTVLEVILQFFILNFHKKNSKQEQEFQDKSDTYSSSVNSKESESGSLSGKESKSTSKFAYESGEAGEAGETIKILGVDKSASSCQWNLSLSREVCDLSTSLTLSSSFSSSFPSRPTSKSTVFNSTVNSSTNSHHHYHYDCHNPSNPLSLDKDKKKGEKDKSCSHTHKSHPHHFCDSKNNNNINTDIFSTPHYQSSEFDCYSPHNFDAHSSTSDNNNNNYHLKSRGPKQQISPSTLYNENDLQSHELISRKNKHSINEKSESSLKEPRISHCTEKNYSNLNSNHLVMSNVQVSKPSGSERSRVTNTSTGSNDNRFNITNTNTNTRPSQTHGNVTSSNVSRREKETNLRRKLINEDATLKNNFRERERAVGTCSSSSSGTGTGHNGTNSFSSRNDVEDNDFNESPEHLSCTSENNFDREHIQQHQQQQQPPDKFDFQIRRNISKFVPAAPNKNRNIHHQSEINLTTQQEALTKLSLAQSLLASKQNMLAEMSLTPEENLERKQSPNGAGSMLFETTCTSSHPSFHSSPHKCEKDDENKMNMTLCDIEDEDFDFEEHGSRGTSEFGKSDNFSTNNSNTQNYHHHHQQQQQQHHQQTSSGVLNIHKSLGMNFKGRETVRTMDVKTWLDLKMTVLGSHSMLQDGWIGQGFVFDHHIPYGLVQTKGGPCGVLAVVQSLILRNLMFGSPFYDDEDLPLSEPITNLDPSTIQLISNRRAKALVYALTEILWRSSHPDQNQSKSKSKWHSNGKDESVWSEFSAFTGNTKNEESSGSSEGAVVCFSNVQAGSEMRVFEQEDDLRDFIQMNLQRFDCMSLVYSAVLSRGLENVENDFDFPNPVLGSHGYCSQELVNLLSTGKAVSNVFDNEVALDEKVLKGIKSRADIGLLSLFEHFDSCQVGSFLKHPKYPVWIVCSESHFSVLFSLNWAIVNNAQSVETFDLFYYDGLAGQEKQIKLTIELVEGVARKSEIRRVHSYVNNNNLDEGIDDDDLVPPLEKCIRTKWKNCNIDWNDTEPIL